MTFALIVAPSGAGKTSVCGLLESGGLTSVPSYTTRKPRFPGERGHIFVDDFETWKAQNPDETLVGYTMFDGNHYWATASQVEENDLYVIDPAGVTFFQRFYHGDKAVLVFYIDVPLLQRFKRILKRGDSFWSALKRIVGDIYRFRDMKKKADVVVRNDTMWKCRDEIRSYLTSKEW